MSLFETVKNAGSKIFEGDSAMPAETTPRAPSIWEKLKLFGDGLVKNVADTVDQPVKAATGLFGSIKETADNLSNQLQDLGAKKGLLGGVKEATDAVVNTIGNMASETFPGLRAAIDSIVEKTPDPYKKFAEDYLKHKPIVQWDSERNKYVINPEGIAQAESLAMGFVGAEGGKVPKKKSVFSNQAPVPKTPAHGRLASGPELDFSNSYIGDQMKGKGFEMPVAQDFDQIDKKHYNESTHDLSKAWLNRIKDFGNDQEIKIDPEGKMILYRGAANPKLEPLSYMTADAKDAARYGTVTEHHVDPRDLHYSSEEQAFIYEPHTKITGTEKLPKLPEKPAEQIAMQTQAVEQKALRSEVVPEQEVRKISSYDNDIIELKKNQAVDSGVNVDNLKISEEGKGLVNQTVDEIKPQIEKNVGQKLSNSEALALAESSSKTLKRAVDREATLEWEAAMLRARQKLAAAAESGKVDKDFVDALLTVKTQGTDIARKLQSLSIEAEAKDITGKQAILEAVLKVTDDADAVVKAAQGVDFTDLNQATDFYRKFVKPKAGEWIDLIRYNSMLSSPLTHIVNTFSNAINTTIVPVIEKLVAGGVDLVRGALTGTARTQFSGEALAYIKAYLSESKKAFGNFSDVLAGKRAFTNLDVRNIPIANKGTKGKIVKALSVPLKLLEASDQLFSGMTQGGELGALKYRAGKGVKVRTPEMEAIDKAAYRVYRQGLNAETQGPLLDAIDQFTSKVQSLRNSPNPIVSTAAKFTVPFLQTPMNIFKQGIEYSPAGIGTVFGAKNKVEQIAKAAIGSSVFAGAATMLSSGRLSWAEPINASQKAEFREQGKQPYSIKIGNRWYSYQKLPPPLAFPFALVAAIDDTMKNKKMDDDTVDLVLTAVSKYGQFLADQSYVKSVGDLLTAFKGGEASISQLISNYPQQLVPYRALSGWVARLMDDTQRKVDNKASFIDKQVQLLMMNVPGLSQNVPARVGPTGEPIKNKDRIINALSPIRTTEEKRGNMPPLPKLPKLPNASKSSIDTKNLPALPRLPKL